MKNSLLLFSPDLKDNPLTESKVNGLIQFLKSQDVNYKIATGVYQKNTELTFVVEWTESNYELVLGLAKFFKQESVLLVDSDGQSYLKFLDNKREVKVGQWSQISNNDTNGLDNFTMIDDKVFTTLQGASNEFIKSTC